MFVPWPLVVCLAAAVVTTLISRCYCSSCFEITQFDAVATRTKQCPFKLMVQTRAAVYVRQYGS